MIRYFVLLGVLLNLAGCTSFFGLDSVFRDRSSDYLKAAELPPIRVPEELDSEALGVAYPVPAAGQVSEYQLEEEFTTPRPQTLGLEQNDQVRIQSLDGETWILVPAPPGEVWPQVRGYLTANQIPAERTDANAGVIETALLNFQGDTSVQHQYRLRLEQGVRLNTTEIVVQHRQFSASATAEDLPDWSSSNQTDSEWVEQMRLDLATTLADTADSGTASLLGQRIGAASKVEVITPASVSADPFILMKLSYNRSWASVEYALRTATFTLESSDREAGLFNLILVDRSAQNRSWLRRLFRGSPEGTAYQVHLQQTDQGVEVRVARPDGSQLEQREAYSLLTLLRSNLA